MPSRTNHPFDILLEKVDGRLVQEIEALFDADLIAQANACEDARAEVGRQNHRDHHPWQAEAGFRPALSVHAFDHWAERFRGHDWRDPDFAKWFAKRNDYARVRVVPRKVVVAVGGLSASASKRFTKSYG